MPTFFNNALINIPDGGNASPFPSGINVQGLTGNIEKVRVKINFTHTYPDDVDILLVGPQGQGVMLMSDAGGGIVLNNTELFFEQSASASLPDESQIVSGSYRPTNYNGGGTDITGVAGSISSSLNVFNNTNPNGIWKLYVLDDGGGDAGNISAWRIDLDTNVSTPGNLIKNGSFEIGPDPNWNPGYIRLNSGSTAIANWKVTGNNIDYKDEDWGASEGFRSLDLNGNAPGGISQTFSTTPGQKYKVSFDLAGNPNLDTATDIKKLRVTAAGQFADFSFNTAGASDVKMNWTGKTWQFTANSNQTTLEFSSLSTEPQNTLVGPALDNVAVVKIGAPPPPLPSLRINDVTLFEGFSGTKPARFTVTLSTTSTKSITVRFATANNTAIAGSDFIAKNGTLTFSPGQKTKTIDILVGGDNAFESDERFFVNLSSAVNATIADAQGVGTIRNDDDPLLNALPNLQAAVREAKVSGEYGACCPKGSHFMIANNFPPISTTSLSSDRNTFLAQESNLFNVATIGGENSLI